MKIRKAPKVEACLNETPGEIIDFNLLSERLNPLRVSWERKVNALPSNHEKAFLGFARTLILPHEVGSAEATLLAGNCEVGEKERGNWRR